MLDYVRHYGEDKIAGMSFIGGITKLGSEQAAAVITPEFLALVPAFFSNNTEESVRGLQSLLRMCFSRPLEEPDFYHMLGYNLAVPPYVRQALFSRQIDNDDLLARLRKPVLITHAATDAIVRGQVVDQHRAGIAHAEVDVIDGTGHACFWEAPSRFNQRLRTFAQGLDRQSIVAAHTAGNMGE
jgi:pimeloyl-ACP methyl ester carboxylesterase